MEIPSSFRRRQPIVCVNPTAKPQASLREIHDARDYLTHEKLWIAFHRLDTIDYRHKGHLFTVGRWRGYEWEDVRTASSASTTLVIGHSDSTVSELDIRKIQNSG